MRQETAHTGTTALMYSGSADGAATDYAYTQVFDTSAHPPTIDANTTLSYWIYPQNSNNSTCVALNMIFSDGTALRNLGAVDQNGNRLHMTSPVVTAATAATSTTSASPAESKADR